MRIFTLSALFVLCIGSPSLVSAQPTTQQGFVERWVLDGTNVRDGMAVAVEGEMKASIEGAPEFDPRSGALLIGEKGPDLFVSKDLSQAHLPKEQITVEAWVAVEHPREWGGIIGAVQDNADSEYGWVLGYQDANFCFGLSSKGADDGDGRMTYVPSESPLEPGRWYHVTGVYDGKEMRIYVDGVARGLSQDQSGPINYPPVGFYVIGAYRDLDEIHRLGGCLREVAVYDRALSEEEIRAQYEKGKALTPQPLRPTLGPYLRFTDRETAEVRWQTSGEEDFWETGIVFEGRGRSERIVGQAQGNEHTVAIGDLKPNTVYSYRLILPDGSLSPPYECDTNCNYAVPTIPKVPQLDGDEPSKPYADAAERILADTGIAHGYCVILGCSSVRLSYELARRSDLRIVSLDPEESRVAGMREQLSSLGIYGPRITSRRVESFAKLPFGRRFANLVVLDWQAGVAGNGIGEEIQRILNPARGAALLLATVESGALAAIEGVNPSGNDGTWVWAELHGSPVPGAGKWTHQYGSTDNSARSAESLEGATRTDQMELQWIGQPGPWAMADRNPRTPAPLFTNDVLFTQGYRRMIASDAYNGTILWSLEVPQFERFNMPRDCGNWCADDGSVYAAVKDACWRLNALTGQLQQVYQVIPPQTDTDYDWGYVANEGSLLYGSAVRAETVYTNIWGKNAEGWYDSPTGPVTYKVCSDLLFALAKDTGQMLWTYGDGVVINTTITIAEGTVYFVECRHPDVKASQLRRVGLKELWEDQFLVALDAVTGIKRWEHPLDTVDGTVVFYMLHAKDKLIIGLSDKEYHLYAFDQNDGTQLWEASHGWTGSDHSGHMQHPTVARNTVYLEPCGYNLDTGERVTDQVARHEGCATYAATEGALIHRGSGRRVSMWDVTTGDSTSWERLRPSCWLSTIAGGGMVLSPEGGGGCSCGGWMESSMAFAKREAR